MDAESRLVVIRGGQIVRVRAAPRPRCEISVRAAPRPCGGRPRRVREKIFRFRNYPRDYPRYPHDYLSYPRGFPRYVRVIRVSSAFVRVPKNL